MSASFHCRTGTVTMVDAWSRANEVNRVRKCGNCDWAERDEMCDLTCVNVASHKCAECVEADYLCDHWTPKQHKRKKQWKK